MSDYILLPSYQLIHNACRVMANQIQQDRLDITRIVGVSRGGLFPALILSHQLKLPLITVDYSSKSGEGDDKNHTNDLPVVLEKGNILLVDDICDSGKTLNELASHFKQYVDTYTAVLYHKTLGDQTIITPDYIWQTIPQDSDWVLFPFERT